MGHSSAVRLILYNAYIRGTKKSSDLTKDSNIIIIESG
jgi:hypothetical protein